MILNPNSTKNSLIVVDGFFSDPEGVRKEALSQEFKDGRPYYPGIRSQRCVTDEVRNFLADQTRMEIDWQHPYSGVFQIMTASDQVDSYVHYDHSEWAGIVYLSEHSGPGTVFYRHKVSGFNTFPSVTEAFRRANQLNISQLELMHSLVNDGKDESKWEPIFHTEFKFNRLVLYPGAHFHRNASAFGLNKEDGRLTQAFFLNRKSPVANWG